MADEVRQDTETKKEEECGDRWHKHHHHKHYRAWGGPMGAPVWAIGWLFTIGYLHLPFFWKGVLALIIWPYYLGASLIH